MKGLSLFSSAGIGELELKSMGLDVVVANELLPTRAKVYSFWHPKSKMICGDITDVDTRTKIITEGIKSEIEFIIATPPCQGVSLIGKNKSNSDMQLDKRNYLIFDAFEIFDKLYPNYILIENVPRYLNMIFNYNGDQLTIGEIINKIYGEKYHINISIYNAADYGVPQNRNRAIIKMWKKGLSWKEIEKVKKISVREAIGDLESLESEQIGKQKNHYSRKHTEAHILCMKNTPTGKSAFQNTDFYPKNVKTGIRLKGYSATYKRIDWDKPAPTITMRNDAISSQSNVHPGRLLIDGTYSDARVLSLREIFILSSMNPDLDIPNDVSDIQIRHMVGEAVPPLLVKSIFEGIDLNEKN